jgi:hypothetical protein
MHGLVGGVREGDEHERLVCSGCRHGAHEGPKIVVGSVAVEEDRGQVLLHASFMRERRRHVAPGPKTIEVGLLGWNTNPWPKITFPSVRRALEAWHPAAPLPLGASATNPPEDPHGKWRLPVAGGAVVRRALGLGAVAMLVGGAGPSLPLPPMPPAAVATLVQPAPVPNGALKPPPVPTARGVGVSLTPNLYRLGREYQGDGFLAGSTIWRYQDRRMPLTPGVDVHVPID